MTICPVYADGHEVTALTRVPSRMTVNLDFKKF